MTAPSAPLTRLALQLGSRRIDVALLPDVAVSDALWAAGVDVFEPGVVVLDSSGTALDLDAPVGKQAVDGGVLHVVAPAPAPRRRNGRSGAFDEDGGRPLADAVLFALGGVAGLVVAVSALLDSSTGSGVGVGAAGAAVVATTAALGVAFTRAGSVSARAAATLAVPALGFAAGVLLSGRGHAAAVLLAVVVGLVLAGVLASVRLVAMRAARDAAEDFAGVVLASCVAAAGVSAAVLLAGLPGAVAAAVLVGVVPLALKALPSLSISVPDEQLIDLAHVSRTAGSVRGAPRRGLGRVNERLVIGVVQGAEHRKDLGTIVLGVLPPLLVPVVLLGSPRGGVPHWGMLVLAACVVVALTLQPRTARGATARWTPRVAAVVVLLEVAVLSDLQGSSRAILVGASIVVAVGLAVVGIPLARGWHSIVLSRVADAVEGLAVMLALPAALVAVDAIETLRRMASG